MAFMNFYCLKLSFEQRKWPYLRMLQTPMYIRQVSAWMGGGNNGTFAQKCNKKLSFPLFRGSGGQIKFLMEKTRGRILVQAGKNIRSTCFLYMGGCRGAKIIFFSQLQLQVGSWDSLILHISNPTHRLRNQLHIGSASVQNSSFLSCST